MQQSMSSRDDFLVRETRIAQSVLSVEDIARLTEWMNTTDVQALRDHPKHRQHYTNAITLLSAAVKSISQFEIDHKNDTKRKEEMTKGTLDCTVKAFMAVKQMIDGIGATLKKPIILPSMFTTKGDAFGGAQPIAFGGAQPIAAPTVTDQVSPSQLESFRDPIPTTPMELDASSVLIQMPMEHLDALSRKDERQKMLKERARRMGVPLISG
jgi:hypothetical protein